MAVNRGEAPASDLFCRKTPFLFEDQKFPDRQRTILSAERRVEVRRRFRRGKRSGVRRHLNDFQHSSAINASGKIDSGNFRVLQQSRQQAPPNPTYRLVYLSHSSHIGFLFNHLQQG
ncbi:MAG TPA: hypothetical protein VEI74_04110 [Candidatus Methylomirabilis sp.]|nr:hypothetical protein [Candidatus Methylomirabilis sp.]